MQLSLKINKIKQKMDLDNYLYSSIWPVLLNPFIIVTTWHYQSLHKNLLKKKNPLISIGSGNGMLPDSTKPFREPKLIIT